MFEDINFEAIRTVFEVLIAPLTGLMAFLYNGVRDELKMVKADLTNLELSISKEYLTRKEFKGFENRIFDRMDDQHSDLSNRFDKLENRLFSIVSGKSIDKN